MSSPADAPPWRLEWTEGLSVFIPEIDAEHRHFIQLVNELNETIARRMDAGVVKACMRAIQDDAVAHFGHEEALFRKWGYPGADDHARIHAQITLALQAIMEHLERGMTEYECVEAGLAVKNTLIEHLLNADMRYRDYFQKYHLSSVGA